MKKFSLLMLLISMGLMLLLPVGCWDSTYEAAILAEIENRTREITNDLIEIRRDFHQYPELAGEEVRTSGIIAEYLTNLGLEVWTGIGGYGVVGILRGEEEGKTIAWRADIDAFATDWPDPVAFRSKNPGVRHICGHDVHATIGLGIANILTSLKDHVKGTVVFIFQPSEENGLGAQTMIDDGLIELVDIDEIYALHMWPLSVGEVSTKQQETYAYQSPLSMVLKIEDVNADIEAFATDLLNNLSNADEGFWENIGDETIGLWSPTTAYKDYLTWNPSDFNVQVSENTVTIETTILSTDKTEAERVPEKLKALLADTEYAGSVISIDIDHIFNVYNDPALTTQSVDMITSMFGNELYFPQYGLMPSFNDDFALFQEQVPGVYFFLGGSNEEKGIFSIPHTPNFVVDEASIEVGVNVFSSLIFKNLMDDEIVDFQ